MVCIPRMCILHRRCDWQLDYQWTEAALAAPLFQLTAGEVKP